MNSNTRYALAGLQAGTVGALGLFSWMTLQARFFGKSIWWVPNLLATLFYGDGALKYASGRYTWGGIALVLFLSGMLGILFGLLWRERAGGKAALVAGISLGVFADFVLVKGLWRQLSPAGALYLPDRQLLIALSIFGALLSTYPRFRDLIASQSKPVALEQSGSSSF